MFYTDFIENELKFTVNYNGFQNIIALLKNDYDIVFDSEKWLKDYYYDTENILYNNDISFRLRYVDIKKKTRVNLKLNNAISVIRPGMFCRRELRAKINEKNSEKILTMYDVKPVLYLNRIITQFDHKVDNLSNVLTLNTHRKSYGLLLKERDIIGNPQYIALIHFDETLYFNNIGEKIAMDSEFELELSNASLCERTIKYFMSIGDMLNSYGFTASSSSKYQRGMEYERCRN